MLSPSTIDAIRDLPIEEVISDYLALKKTGAHSYKCNCPFHNENTPSFAVDTTKNIFKCFGCGAGGDAIEFVMLKENLPFIEACKAIAGNHGIAIEETALKGKTPEQKRDEETMMDLLHQAQVKYAKVLNENSKALNYLRSERNLTQDTINEWQLGLCHDWKVLASLISTGQHKLAEACGLIRTGNGNTYDYFNHRITIPIHNTQGQL